MDFCCGDRAALYGFFPLLATCLGNWKPARNVFSNSFEKRSLQLQSLLTASANEHDEHEKEDDGLCNPIIIS